MTWTTRRSGSQAASNSGCASLGRWRRPTRSPSVSASAASVQPRRRSRCFCTRCCRSSPTLCWDSSAFRAPRSRPPAAWAVSRPQLLWRVELPLGSPLLFTGIRLAAVTVVATALIAAVAGGGGLGDVIVNQASYRLEGVLGASYCVMALSAGVWLALLALQEGMTPKALRPSRVPGAANDRRELL